MKRQGSLFGRIFLYRRGRVAAALVLLLFALLMAATALRDHDAPAPQTPAQRLFAWVAAPLGGVQEALFDGYQRLLPRKRQAQAVAIVAIDENSLKALGQWPWPRSQLAALIDAIARYDPVAIGLDIYMPEADQTSPEQVARRLGPDQAALADALRQQAPNDVRLARSLRDAPTVLGAAGFEFATDNTRDGLRTVPMRVQGGDALAALHRFPYVLTSLPELQVAAHGQGLLSVRVDAVVRRISLAAAVGIAPTPSLAMEMLRVASGSDAIDVHVDAHGIRSFSVAELTVPTQSGGDVWLHFAHADDAAEFRNISAVELLNGKVSGDALQHKLVLVGLTGSGLNDRRVTPLDESVPGIEIQAQLLESLLDGRMLLRPWWMPHAEVALLLLLGLAMIVWIPDALARHDAQGVRKPRRVGIWVSLVIVLALGGGLLLFQRVGWLFDGGGMSLAFAAVLASLVSSSTLEVERDNQRLAMAEYQLRENAARLAGEMEAARRIQLGSLPDARTAFAGEQRFVVDALIEPAREVGGDLYDFFMVDAQRLCFLIGDVSGKGVPASMFMAVAKTLSRSFATRLAGGPSVVVSAANRDLSRGNVETLFVTMLLGVLDVETGALELVNAGHDAPWLLRRDEAARQLIADAQAGGPPLCVLEDFAYSVQHLQLLPGDSLVMVTDGITEAANPDAELYGNARLQAALSSAGSLSPVHGLLQHLRQDVASFVDGAEASDDLAVLVLRWNGPTAGADPVPGA
jgi:serine phosphatase RsbU (regulator of sigma subunit)